MNDRFCVLGIETSCDDTSMAIMLYEESGAGVQILSHRSFNQEKMLQPWGGVVPEIAARNHMEMIIPILNEVMKEAQINFSQLDCLAVTTHPGLLGPLLTGLNLAKTLSLVLKIPIVGVNHLFAHLQAIYLSKKNCDDDFYPYLGLLVSGGHSIYFWVTSPVDFHPLGETIDDAAGEAFDKGGRLLGLPYPAGKFMDVLAQKGDGKRFSFPIGLKEDASANLSFSGVKTALKKFIETNPEWIATFKNPQTQTAQQLLCDVVASYQSAIIAALSLKLRKAICLVEQNLLAKDCKQQQTRAFPIIVGGGVAANSALRKEISKCFQAERAVFFVAPEFCADNGAMIANYAIQTHRYGFDLKVPFPQSLKLDAAARFYSKKLLGNGQYQ